MAGRAWILISKEPPDRQYGGNTGYEDKRRVLYRYDSTVPNHKQLAVGDLVLVRNSLVSFGVAVIESLAESMGTKELKRCPLCKTTGIKSRKNANPIWRCNNKHEFVAPLCEEVQVNQYVAEFGDTYCDIDPPLDAKIVRAAAIRPNDQLSIEEVSLGKLEPELLKACPTSRALVERFTGGIAIELGEALVGEQQETFSGSMVDNRQSVLKSVLLRRGQAKFRNLLIARYGPRCMVTGCSLMDVVEAAHIKPYRGKEDNHPANGLLLRADLHTMFDLQLLGIEPSSLKVQLHPCVEGLGYDDYHLAPLKIGSQTPSVDALTEQWRLFRKRQNVTT